jgi:hypothetical protein
VRIERLADVGTWHAQNRQAAEAAPDIDASRTASADVKRALGTLSGRAEDAGRKPAGSRAPHRATAEAQRAKVVTLFPPKSPR